MRTLFNDGKIIAEGMAFEKALYDVSNNKISVQFDGKGTIYNYSITGKKVCYNCELGCLKIIIGGEEVQFNTPKRVEMIGRRQVINYAVKKSSIVVKMFVDKEKECVFEQVEIKLDSPKNVEIGLFMGEVINEDTADKTYCAEFKNGFSIAADRAFKSVSPNKEIIFDFGADKDAVSLNMVYGFDNPEIKDLCNDFENYDKDSVKEIEEVKLPASIKTETEKAIYYNTYFCALENYKELGDFKGFMAGCHYVAPARTYYRDSYFTVLAMYNGHRDKIRNEIITLSKGIAKDGSCPSAVISDFSAWWGNHFDSPSMLCIMVYDYVNNTDDFTILDESTGTGTVMECLERVIAKLSLECDETGLIKKQGRYNERDWADNVHRIGYTAYDEILYARALYCMSILNKNRDDARAKAYLQSFEKVKAAINKILWDESLGYYLNYKSEIRTENNLSVDTILAVIYGIADERQSNKMLDNFERMLESRKHSEIEDFGVMCVYPPYSGIDVAWGKSTRQLEYHNGADWPYWSAMYAYALKMYGRDYAYALTRWFEYNVKKGNYTPIEFYSPYCKDGSLLQAWSSAPAFVYWDEESTFFKNKI